MISSRDISTRFLLRTIGEEYIDYINSYVDNLLREGYVKFNTEEEITEFFKTSISNLTLGDAFDIRGYTGTSFKEINNTLRGTWNYQENGMFTEDKANYYRELANSINEIIGKSGIVSSNFIIYRGVDIWAFNKFGVTSLEDLLSLKGQFIYDAGFLSTALIRDRSFFDRELEALTYRNIEIEFLIPGDNEDGIALIGEDLSYSPGQTEYLINKGNLSKVIDVSIDKEKNRALIKMVYIPKKVWDREYAKNRNSTITR